MSTTMPDPSPYVTGTPHPNANTHPTVETKPSPADYTGGGYEHARSYEARPHTPGDRKEHVYASIHRLAAIVWCYDSDEPLGAVLDDLRGKDVHHESGVPWDNREANLSVVDHGRHAEITQSQRRAWAADKKHEIRTREQEPLTPDDGPACDNCGATDAPLARGDAFDGEWCPECIERYKDRQRKLQELTE